MSLDIQTSLNNSKNKIVLLRMRDNKTIKGILQSFDVHLNLILDDAEEILDSKTMKLGNILLRGSNIVVISLPKEQNN
jgi:small nuclear ribonucleoprotein